MKADFSRLVLFLLLFGLIFGMISCWSVRGDGDSGFSDEAGELYSQEPFVISGDFVLAQNGSGVDAHGEDESSGRYPSPTVIWSQSPDFSEP